MSMPKTTMYKNNGLITAQDNIWRTRQFFIMQSITETTAMQITAHEHFRFCVIALDSSHYSATF